MNRVYNLEPLTSVATATFDIEGRLLEANTGFRRLLEANSLPSGESFVARFFIQPDFPSLISNRPDANGEIYNGLLTLGRLNGRTWTLNGRVWRDESRLVFLGEHDIEDMQRLNSTILELNSNYADVQLEVVQSNLKIKHLNAQLSEHRDRLEELVLQRTAELAAARDAADAANRTKRALLANISHELRTPINGIIGMTGLVRNMTPDSKQTGWLDKSLESANHLLSIIDSVMDYARIESQQLDLVEKEFSPKGLLDDAVELYTERARVRGLQISRDLDHKLPSELYGDVKRLQQILHTLIDNAIKFSDHGQINVGVKLGSSDTSSVVLLMEVEDQGIGLSPAQQTEIFRTFRQADNSRTRKYGGIGMSLAVSRRIAQLMGGTVGVESVEGEGSTFWVTTRLKRIENGTRQQNAVGSLSLRDLLARRFQGTRVLVAEELMVDQELAKYLLESARLSVDLVSNWENTIKLANNGDYAMLILDLQLLIRRGAGAIGEIRGLLKNSEIPILALYARDPGETRHGILAEGLNDLVEKPIDPDTFYTTLVHWLYKTRNGDRTGHTEKAPVN